MQKKILDLLKNIKHPAGIAALIVSLAIPALIAWAGNESMAGSAIKEIVGKLDLNLPFWLFAAQAILGVLLLVDLYKDLGKFIRSLNPGRNWLIAIGVFTLVATLATGILIEGRHRVQSDESIFLSTAQNLYSQQVAGACDEGEFVHGKLDCAKNANNFKARGLGFVYMVGMPIFGSNLQWIFAFHLVLYFLTGILFFAAVYAWTRLPFLALLSSVLLLMQPTVMFQFRSSSVEPLYVFLSALALLVLKWCFERDTVRHWVLLALTLAFFAQTRQETVFCLGAFILFALPRLLSSKDLRFPAFISTLAIFSIPVLLTISYHQGYDFQGGEFSAHGNFLRDLAINWDVMAKTPVGADGLLANPFLTSSTVLGLLGALTLLVLAYYKKEARLWLGFLVLYHIQTYMVLENVSGDFTIEINQRYSLVFLPTLAFLAALFLHEVIFRGLNMFMGLKWKSDSSNNSLLVAGSVAFILMCMTLRYQDSFKADIMYNRNHLTTEEHQILQWVRSQPEKPRLFIYARPWHFIGYGYSSMHYDKIRSMGSGELDALLAKYAGEVYYVRGLDCWDRETWHKKAVEHRIATTCDDFERKFEIESVHSEIITNNFELNIARIKGVKEYDQNSLAALGVFNYIEEKKEVHVSYQLAQVPPKKWSYRLWLNDSLWRDKPYQPLAIMDTLAHANMVPGYNTIRLAVFDSAGALLSSRETSAFFPLGKATPLVKITPVSHEQSWGDLQTNQSVKSAPLHVAGRNFSEGLGTHAFSRISYDLAGRYKRFTALVGQDDEELGGDGLQFRVVGDGKTLWTSPVVKAKDLVPADVEVSGVKTLVLEVDSLANKDFDHADWLLPTLFQGAK